MIEGKNNKYDYRGISHIAGMIFIDRTFPVKAREDFRKAVCDVGGESLYESLSPDVIALFEEGLHHPRLWEVIKLWWKTYDEARAWGEIPAVKEFWRPTLEDEAKDVAA